MEKYKQLLAAITNIVRLDGYTKKGDTFYLFKNNNWGLLNFQRSVNKTGGIISFTLNLGVCSTLLRKLIDHADLDTKPEIERCHWNARIGSLLPESPDYWWHFTEQVPYEEIEEDVLEKIRNIALPAISEHISDIALEKVWTEGGYSGTTIFKRFVYVTTLLKAHNDERLQNVIEEFLNNYKGRSYEDSAKEHVKELGLF